ncbi:hypothetical protein BACPEC_00148 [[Bacteroides] pectinophilus ATCC 43243]|uniref:Uncharacterized protein n=1 Tax=[Bacteroides] pectinophilus ATCC 43243 TaxID=483218 RepID=B7AN94_9FIRM|nr:hypothetical protein BACPEC_00148 [[Bacteroides] pectinophilus ATCC 43243]
MRTFILISIPQAQSAGGIAGLISDLALRQMLFVEPASQTAYTEKRIRRLLCLTDAFYP